MLNCASLPTAYLTASIGFRIFNDCKDCLVSIVGVIAGGLYDQGRDLNAKLHDHFFIFNSFVSKDGL